MNIINFILKIRNKENRYFKKWLTENQLSEYELKEQENFTFSYNPKISIIIPMYNTKEKYLKELMMSLNNQTYKNIEICLADGSREKNSYINKYINEKVKYKLLNENKGIAGNTNEALKMATGEYIAFMDHDDTLNANCMFEIVKLINQKTNVEFIYTDDDKIIDETNEKVNPQFKPDFSEDMLYSNNYICHLTVLKKSLVDKIGGLNAEYEGAQDYDYILRAIKNVTSKENIVHIPKILYNWRISNESVAGKPEAKPYAYENGKMVLKNYFSRIGINVNVKDNKLPGFYKIEYIYEKEEKIIIVIRKKNKDYKKCIEHIKKSSYKNYEIVIIEDNTASKEKELISKKNGEYILFIDSDTLINEHTIKEMFSIINARKNIGIVGGKVVTKHNRIYQIGRTITKDGKISNIAQGKLNLGNGYMGRLIINQNMLIVSNKLFLIKKEDYLTFVDENEQNDEIRQLDLCLKLYEKGRINVFVATAEAVLTHTENPTKEKVKRWEKYKGINPYINPNYKI